MDDYSLFASKVNLFKDLPPVILSALDMTGFHLPSTFEQTEFESLEKKLGCYIVPYKGEVFNTDVPIQTHLCAILKGADLTPFKLAIFLDAEKETKKRGITLVAYQKPFILIDYQTSEVYKYYSQKGLL